MNLQRIKNTKKHCKALQIHINIIKWVTWRQDSSPNRGARPHLFQPLHQHGEGSNDGGKLGNWVRGSQLDGVDICFISCIIDIPQVSKIINWNKGTSASTLVARGTCCRWPMSPGKFRTRGDFCQWPAGGALGRWDSMAQPSHSLGQGGYSEGRFAPAQGHHWRQDEDSCRAGPYL